MQRFDIIKYLIKLYNFQSYLEIGVLGRDTFDQISTPIRHGVDPNGAGDFKMTSDEFFNKHNFYYDLIFIDGLHLHKQALKDIENSLTHLNDNGIIMVHDVYPEQEYHQLDIGISGMPWTGTVWKAWADLRCTRKDLSMFVINTDWGCGIIRRGQQILYPYFQESWTWNYFLKHKKELLNLITVDEFLYGEMFNGHS